MNAQKFNTIENNYELPSSYGVTRLTLLVRDPHWIHAYWEITDEDLCNLKKRMDGHQGQSHLALRMYDVTLKDFNGSNANHSFDIELNGETNNWYINLWADNVTYCAEIGLKASDGAFYPVARSNCVTTQRKDVASRKDLIWMEVSDGEIGKTYVQEQKKEAQASSWKKWHITPDDIRAYYAKLIPSLRRLRPLRKRSRQKELLMERQGFPFESWAEEQTALFSMTQEKWEKIFLGSSAELLRHQAGGASESLVAGLSAEASEQNQTEKHRKFFFEIGTELIVYGRTEPDATVTLGEEKIPLHKDGTFKLRFALPDAGNIPLDFTATSADKIEQRKILTSAHRTKTMYSP